jgi:hypothetical protein
MQLFTGELKDIGPTIGVLCFGGVISLLGMFTPFFTAESNGYHIASVGIFGFIGAVCISTLGYSIHLVPTEPETAQVIEMLPMPPPVERPVTAFYRPGVPPVVGPDLQPLMDQRTWETGRSEREWLANAEHVEVQRLAREMQEASVSFQKREQARREEIALERETGIVRRFTRYWPGADGAAGERETGYLRRLTRVWPGAGGAAGERRATARHF